MGTDMGTERDNPETNRKKPKPARTSNGQFAKGNSGGGRKPGSTVQLRHALAEYEKKHNCNFLETYFAMAMEDKATMRDLLSRLYPTLRAVNTNVTGDLGLTLTDIAARMGVNGSTTD